MALTFGPLYRNPKKDFEDLLAYHQYNQQSAPQQSAPQPNIPKPSQSSWDKVRDIFDANSPMDKFKRQQAGEPVDNPNQSILKNIGNVANEVAKNPMVRYNPLFNPAAIQTAAYDAVRGIKPIDQTGKTAAQQKAEWDAKFGKEVDPNNPNRSYQSPLNALKQMGVEGLGNIGVGIFSVASGNTAAPSAGELTKAEADQIPGSRKITDARGNSVFVSPTNRPLTAQEEIINGINAKLAFQNPFGAKFAASLSNPVLRTGANMVAEGVQNVAANTLSNLVAPGTQSVVDRLKQSAEDAPMQFASGAPFGLLPNGGKAKAATPSVKLRTDVSTKPAAPDARAIVRGQVEAPKSIETIPAELKSSGLIQAKEIIPMSKLKTSKGVVLDNELTQSIKQNGVVPLLVDKDNMIFEGQHRLKSLEAIGAKEAPIYRIDMDKFNKLSEDQKLDFLDNYNLSKTDNINIQYPKVALKGEQPRPTGFTKAGEALDMSRYQRTGQTPEQAQIADIAKRTGVSEETLTREAARRGGIDKIEGTANSLIDDTVARNKDAVFVSKLKDTPVVKEAAQPKVVAKDMLPAREDVPYDVDPVTGTYRTAADMIDNAPEAKKVSAVQAQEIAGAIVNRVDEGMDAVDNILKAKGSSLEEMFRAIQAANRNGDAFPEQFRAEYNMVKATLDKLRDSSGKQMGDIGDGYIPQYRVNGGPQVQVGKSLVELIDVEDFGFSKKRENLIPLDELDYTKEGIKKYATQAMSYKYRDALDIEAIQKRAMETDGVNLTDKEALAVRDKEVEIAKEVQEAASKPGAILKADILDKTDELAAVKKKKRIEIADGVSFAKRELLDTDTLTRDIQLRTPEGKTKNMFEVFGFRRYRDAEGNAKQILYKSLEEGDYDSIKQHIADTNLPENVQKNLLKQLGDDLRAVQSKIDELDLPESKVADATKELYEGALTKFERRIAREELTRAMETYKIKNKGLRKVVNFHAQRMLTHDGYTRNMAEKATNFVTGLYYRGALGYNVSSALLNLFELQRVTSEVGMINGAKAISKALTDWDIAKRYGLHESTFENLLELKKEGVNVKKNTLSKVENYSGLMKMFEWTERIKDATLLHALEAKYADAGLSNQARVTRILADFNKLAIKGGQFGSVGLYKSKTGRTLFQFMQYPIKDLTITMGKVGKAFNGDTEASKYLARLLVQRTILYMVMNAAIGTSAEVAFGIFNPVRQSRIDEEASNAEKVVSYFPGGPAVSMLKDTYIAIQQAQREAERNDEQFDMGDVLNQQVKRDLTILVPGGNQIINKTLGFQADMDRGYNQTSYKNSKGEEVNQARFAAPDNPIDIAKGYVFGPYSTKDANEYFGKKLGSDLPIVGKALEGERYSPVSKRQQERISAGGNARELIEEERINQRAKKEFKKTNPNLWAAYQEITKTTYNESTKKRESDVITPEKWSKVYGDSSLKLYDYMKQMAEARNKQYGDPIDPLYKLTDKAKIKTVLELRSTFTGDDKEPKEILKARSPWFAQFQKDEANYYNSLGKFEEDSEFGSSDRKKQYIELGKQNPGIPDISKQKYPIISKYFDMKEKNPDAAKEFYKSNADALSTAFEQQKKDRWEWTNQMRSLEGAPAIPWEAFQNVTFGFESDEEKVYKQLKYGKGYGGYGKGGSRKVSMKAAETYGTELRAGATIKKPTVKKIAMPSSKPKTVTIAKPKVSMKKSKV